MGRVLVVEDNVFLRYTLAHWLRMTGHEVTEAATADEARAVLQSIIAIDIVVTDVEMPGSMSGLDLTAYLRETYPSLPVIVVSGKSIPQDFNAASAFFQKPYDLGRITARIEALLIKSQSIPVENKKAEQQ
jgi:CheY-like chemotaxis protein